MHLDLVTIVVPDQDEALAFFVGALGFEVAEDAPSTTTDGRVAVFQDPWGNAWDLLGPR